MLSIVVVFFTILWLGSLYHSRNDLAVYAASLSEGNIYDSDFLFNFIQIILIYLFGPNFVLTGIQAFIILLAIRLARFDIFRLLILVSSTAFVTTYFNAIRSGLAFFWVILVFEQIAPRKAKNVIVLSALSLLIHKSAILLILMFFSERLTKFVVSRKRLLGLFVLLLALFLALLPYTYFTFDRYQFYFTSENTIVDGRFGVIKLAYWIIVICFIVLFLNSSFMKVKDWSRLLPIFLNLIVCIVLSCFMGVNELVSRVLMLNNFWLLVLALRQDATRAYRLTFVILSITSPSSIGVLL